MLYKLYAHYTNILSLGNKPRFLLLPFVLTRESLAKEKKNNGNIKECVANFTV